MDIPLWCQIKYSWKLRSKIQQFTFLEIHQKKNNLKASEQLEKVFESKTKEFLSIPNPGITLFRYLAVRNACTPTNQLLHPCSEIVFDFTFCDIFCFHIRNFHIQLDVSSKLLAGKTFHSLDSESIRIKLRITKLFEQHESCWACQQSMYSLLTSWDS